MTKIVGVNEWSDVTLLEDGDKISGGINGKANEQSIALVNRTNWLKEKIEDDSNGVNTSEDEKLLWLSTNLADPLLSSKYPKVGQVLAVSEAKSNLSGKETLTYKLINLPAGGTKGETGPAGPQGDRGIQGECGSFVNVTNRGQWYLWDTYAINDMVRYRMEGGVVDQTYISLINENLGNPPNSHPSSQEWAMISQDGRDGQGGSGENGEFGKLTHKGYFGFLDSYKKNDVVRVDNAITLMSANYVAKIDNTGKDPKLNPDYWTLISYNGADGREGMQGEPGQQGEPGPPMKILDHYTTLSELQSAHPTGSVGDVYSVGVAPDVVLYIWNQSSWQNIGPISTQSGGSGGGYGLLSLRKSKVQGSNPDGVDYFEKITRMPSEINGQSWIVFERTYHNLGNDSEFGADWIIWDHPIINGIGFLGFLDPSPDIYTNHRGSYYGGGYGMEWNENPQMNENTTISAPIEMRAPFGFMGWNPIFFQSYAAKISPYGGQPQIVFKKITSYAFTFEFTFLVDDSDYNFQ